jgi:type VI secretion system protein ImpF
MAGESSVEKIFPCLLIRLTDDSPTQQKESLDNKSISLRRYKESVLRDIECLLNSHSPFNNQELAGFAEVEKSVINYGLRDLCGVTISSTAISDIESSIKQTLLAFEPRIIKNSLAVRAVTNYRPYCDQTISFEIEAQIWAQPSPEYLLVKTEIDVETGRCSLKD